MLFLFMAVGDNVSVLQPAYVLQLKILPVHTVWFKAAECMYFALLVWEVCL